MPEITGEQLSQKLIDVRPDIPVILCTGFSELVTEGQARDIGIREYIMKPVMIGQLARTIRGGLDIE